MLLPKLNGDEPICEKHSFKGWDCPRCTFERDEQRKWEATEWYCVNEFLNKLSVPKSSAEDKVYSTVGRICALIRMCESSLYPKDILKELESKQ